MSQPTVIAPIPQRPRLADRIRGRLAFTIIPRHPLVAGLAGAIMLVLMYLGIITAAESFSHALDQMRTDAVWVGLVAVGLGIQMALYARVRQLVSAAGSAQSKAMTGAGTGTSTAGMVACCAHHLVDIAPLLGLTGATAFLSEYRLAFIGVGLAVNAVGIGFSVRTLRQVIRHQREMAAGVCHGDAPDAPAPESAPGHVAATGRPACH